MVREDGRLASANVLYLDDLGEVDPGLSGAEVEDLLPTKANLGWAFRTWLAGRVHDDDVIVVFYAGHAVAIPPHATDDAQAGHPARAFLLPADARLSQCERTGWRLDEAIDPWASTGRNPIVCWLDTSLHGRGRSSRRPRTGQAETTGRPFAPAEPRPLAGRDRLARRRGPARRGSHGGRRVQPLHRGLCAGLGTPARPANLLACLDALLHDPALTRPGVPDARRDRSQPEPLVIAAPAAGAWPSASSSSSAAMPAASRRSRITTDGDRMITGAQGLHHQGLARRRPDRAAGRFRAPGRRDLPRREPRRPLARQRRRLGRLRLRNLVHDLEVPTGPVHDARGRLRRVSAGRRAPGLARRRRRKLALADRRPRHRGQAAFRRKPRA